MRINGSPGVQAGTGPARSRQVARITMSKQWYALRCKPRKEDAVWRLLLARGEEGFYPRLRVNPVNPRARKWVPYFPGYMFIQTDVEEVGLSAYQWMPHTLGLVQFGGEPALVPENLIHELRVRLQAIAAGGGEILDALQAGDRVRIEAGPFEGYEAIFDTRLAGTERVRVLLKLIGARQVPLELRAGQVSKIKPVRK